MEISEPSPLDVTSFLNISSFCNDWVNRISSCLNRWWILISTKSEDFTSAALSFLQIWTVYSQATDYLQRRFDQLPQHFLLPRESVSFDEFNITFPFRSNRDCDIDFLPLNIVNAIELNHWIKRQGVNKLVITLGHDILVILRWSLDSVDGTGFICRWDGRGERYCKSLWMLDDGGTRSRVVVDKYLFLVPCMFTKYQMIHDAPWIWLFSRAMGP